jgi:Holliday junction resolvase-like predicted endonuclease
VEVKEKTSARRGDPLEMVGPEKQRRIRRAADTWLAAHPDAASLLISFDVVAVRDRHLERVEQAF